LFQLSIYSHMSLTFTLTGKNSIPVFYFPAVDLSNSDYEFGLTDFETYHTISNINSLNNKFYLGEDKEIVIPEESYEIHDINEYLRRTIL